MNSLKSLGIKTASLWFVWAWNILHFINWTSCFVSLNLRMKCFSFCTANVSPIWCDLRDTGSRVETAWYLGLYFIKGCSRAIVNLQSINVVKHFKDSTCYFLPKSSDISFITWRNCWKRWYIFIFCFIRP